jgi:hypothetical protein
MAEFSFGEFFDIRLHLVPGPLIVADLFAVGADRNNPLKYFYF